MRKSITVLSVALALCLLTDGILRVAFLFTVMDSDSMLPLVKGNSTPTSHDGDFVVAARWFRTASLRTGDLVVVDIPTAMGPVLTIRKIEQQADTPAGQFYLRAVKTNGIDSRQFGALPAKDLQGKVIWIKKGS